MVRSPALLLLSGLALVHPASAATAGTLAGRVVVDGRPAVGATVSAIPVEEPLARARREARGEAEPEPLATTAAGPDGAFSLTVPAGAGRTKPFRLRLAAKGAVPVDHFDVREATESDDLGEIPLRKAAPLAGRVSGPGGRPVAGAQVALLAQGTLRDTAVLFPPARQTTTTGADGTFLFETAAVEGNELVVRAAGLAPVRVRGARSGALPRTVALAPGTSRSGQVKTRGGQPAAGVVVRLEWDGLETPWVETGADGSFRLAGLPPRRGTVVADAGDAGFASVSVDPGDAAGPLVVTLAPPTVLEGRTLDVATLVPVPGVKLVVASESETRVGPSGADGRYAFVNLRPGGVTVRAEDPRYVSWSRSDVPVARGETRRLDVPLTRGAALAGRVVDEDGRPVAGASVNLGAADENPFFLVLRRMTGDPGAKIVSRADGTFSASRLESGSNRRLTVYHPDFEKGVLGGISLVPGGTRSGAVVTLRRGVVVTGTVTDGDGNPVAGAELTVSESRAVRSSSDGRRIQASFGGISEIAPVRTGPDGRFELKGVPPGDVALTATAPGRATKVVDPLRLSRDARPDPVDVVLAPGAVLSGFVKRRTGEGAEGFLVVAHEPGTPPAAFDPDTNPTGPDGAFSLDGLKAGVAYDLRLVSLADVEPGPTKRGVVAPATDLEWVVPGLGRIEGVALDARTGEPLSEFEVSCEQDGADLSMMGMRRGMGRRTPGGVGEPVVVEAADGRFVLEEVPAGKWQAVVMARGYLVGRAAGVVVEEGTTTEGVEVRLPRGALLEGRVVDARTRKGVPGARVEVSGEAGLAVLRGLGREGLFTDADGKFAAEGLAPGRALVSVKHDDYAAKRERVLIAEDGGRVEVALSRGGALGGVVLSEGRQPVAGAEVSLEGANAPGGWAGNETASDESGRFRYEHLSPGRYTVRAAVEGRASESVETVLVGDEEKGDVTLVLVGGATIRGAVAGLPDGPRAGIRVNANGPKGYWATARTGPDGRFELAGAPAGEISLRATAGDLGAGTVRTATGRVSIAEGQREAEAELLFEGDGALSGRVTRGGKPVASVRVSLRERRGTHSGSGRTDEGGTYRVEGLAAGDYEVEIEAPEGGRDAKRSVRIAGEATLDVELPTASLAGFVVDAATKEPVSEVRVAALGGAAGPSGFATSDTNGRFFVADVEPGAYALAFRRAGYRERRVEAEATEAGGDAGTIELTRGDGLELVVRDGIFQIPIRSVSVRVSDPSGTTILSTGLLLDGEGKGELTSLRPGRHTLTISSSGYATRVLDGIVVPGAPLPVLLTPGGSVEVRSGEASRAKGAATLRDAAGRPHPFRSWGRPGEVTLSPAGTQLLSNLAPGSYTLEVEAVATKGFSVTEGGVTVVELP